MLHQKELDIIEKFWQLEEVGTKKQIKPEDAKCHQLFKSTTCRENDGRLSVRLPFKESPNVLGLSYFNADRRLMAMERKFSKNLSFAKHYHNFMLEYLTLGHMELIPDDEVHTSKPHFYLPHHAVCKDESTTTKLRVVFDGSCKSSFSASLNDILFQGPLLQDELTSILMRFRLHSIAISADIAKMYRQVNLQKEDREFQRIIWRNDTSKPIQHYRLNTVTYGITSAPFLAIRSMLELSNIHENEYPIAAPILQRDFYVDDMLTGCEDVSTAETIYHQMSQLLKQGGFNIRKWISNSPKLMQSIPIHDHGTEDIITFDDQPTYYKTLGLHWAPSHDWFQYKVNIKEHTKLTKRNLLSEASRVFDPLGLIAPITIRFKILFQETWKKQLEWDQELPDEISSQWKAMKSALPLLKSIKIDRCIKIESSTFKNLHIFCDASQQAYGAAVYLRSLDSAGKILIRLVAAKSRVAPINTVSLPRLELCAAELGTKLYNYVNHALGLSYDQVFAWTDSQVVLAWLADHLSRWTSFVANRVATIKKSVSYSSWRYIESKLNPGDHTSRGLSPQQLINNQLWWSGPEFLMHQRSSWPTDEQLWTGHVPEERKSKIVSIHTIIETNKLTVATNIHNQLFTRFSSLQKIYRIIGYVCRYRINKCLQKLMKSGNLQKKRSDLQSILPPTTCEIEIAENICRRWAQKIAFSDELKALNQNKSIPRNSKLLKLTPFIDENQIIRVGGRLSQVDCEYNVKHPIVLH